MPFIYIPRHHYVPFHNADESSHTRILLRGDTADCSAGIKQQQPCPSTMSNRHNVTEEVCWFHWTYFEATTGGILAVMTPPTFTPRLHGTRPPQVQRPRCNPTCILGYTQILLKNEANGRFLVTDRTWQYRSCFQRGTSCCRGQSGSRTSNSDYIERNMDCPWCIREASHPRLYHQLHVPHHTTASLPQKKQRFAIRYILTTSTSRIPS